MEHNKNKILEGLTATLRAYPGIVNMRVFTNMSGCIEEYEEDVNQVDTTCCPAGLIPATDIDFASNFITEDGDYDFRKMSFCLVNKNHLAWHWLFNAVWSDSAEQAIFRIEYLLKKRQPPMNFKCSSSPELPAKNDTATFRNNRNYRRREPDRYVIKGIEC